MRALCLGSATCKDDDLKRARGLGISVEDGWILVAVNHVARDWPGELPHWASFHANFFPRWAKERETLGFPPAANLWTGHRRNIPVGMGVQQVANWGGSSGLLAVTVACHLGASAIVCCGIPLDRLQGHYDKPDVPWKDAANYRHGWDNRKKDGFLTNVRSMSGWTAELLGEPTAEWVERTA